MALQKLESNSRYWARHTKSVTTLIKINWKKFEQSEGDCWCKHILEIRSVDKDVFIDISIGMHVIGVLSEPCEISSGIIFVIKSRIKI